MLLFNHRGFSGARFILILALLAGLFGIVPVTPVYAATITVPDNYATIQAAINAASPGDTIVVRAGTYSENLTLSKSVILTAASFDSGDPTRNTTIINGKSSTKPVILIPAGLSPMPVIRGFIIRNGLDNIIVASEAVIEYNYFIGSIDQLDYIAGGGGFAHHNVFFDSQDDAIDLDNMNRSLLIENNRLMYNRDDGIEVRLQDATAPAQPITITIRNNEIIGCDEDGIQFIDYGQTVNTNRNYVITGNVIANCRFAGIGLMGNTISVEDYSGADIVESIQVYNNTIYGNNYGISGGDNLIAYNNIIANSTTRGVWKVAGVSSVVAYTLFHNNGMDADQSTLGAGNKFGQNPLFASVPTPGPDGVWRTVDDDFRGLAQQYGSPAIDAGYDPVCPAIDLRGVGRPQGRHCDLGAFEGGTAPMPGPKPPVAASLISPSGNINDNTQPTYMWNVVLNSSQGDAAIWYLLSVKRKNNTVVLSEWYEASKVCTGNTCSIRPSILLTNGVYSWEVRTWNNSGYGPVSIPLSFIVGLKPGQASLIAPSGSITNNRPTFSWNVAPDSTTTDPAAWYYLYVSGPSGFAFASWYEASKICNASTCTVANATNVRAGAHTWYVQTWNDAGHGPWSSAMNFTAPTPPPPGKATLVSPTGSIATNNPTYTWNKVADAESYYLYVGGPSNYAFAKWYAASAVCGASTCSVANATTLGAGAHAWYVQTWSSTAGYGPWSTGMSFSPTPPGAATLTSPSGSLGTNNPTYTWKEAPGASWYYLYVQGPSNYVFANWYPASTACRSGTCSVANATSLGTGAHTWWVQTWNNAGPGAWSTSKNFSVSP